jgi:hypothetical protein
VIVQHDVGGFDITKDDWPRLVTMQVDQHFTDLDGPTHYLYFRQETLRLGQNYLQVSAVYVLFDEITALTLAEIVVDLNDAGMTEGGKDVGFTLEGPLDQGPYLGIGGGVE